MDNLYTAIILFIIALNSKSNQLTILMIAGCLVAWLIDVGPLTIEAARQLLYGELSISDANEFLTDNDEFDFDIALYYSLNAILFSLLALSAVKLKNTSPIFYAIIMLIQMFFCLLLIPSWGEAGNTLIQNTVIYYNDGILIITLLLGVSGSENAISNGFNNSYRSGGVCNYSNRGDS